MLKIRKDGLEYIVTQGAYENLYKGMGFQIVSGATESKPTPVKEVVKETASEQKVEEPKEEKIEEPKASKFSGKSSK